jgi:hypothetical protein
MNSIDIISIGTTNLLRDAAEEYQSVLRGFPSAVPGVDRFAQEFFEKQDEQFATRITPNTATSFIDGEDTKLRVESLSVAVNSLGGLWRLTTQVELGKGVQPAVLVGPVIYMRDDESPTRRSADWNEMTRALTEAEGHGLTLDICVATKRALHGRRRLLSMWSIAKAKVLAYPYV